MTFADLKSQDHISLILKGQVKDGTYSHSYLFTGPRGCGKTSAARILARAINCDNPENGEPCNICNNCISVIEGTALDVIEIDAASNRSIDDIRDFKEKVNFQPVSFKKKVFIIDEVHMLTKEAFNALLKTLEEPPEFVVFILATTDIHKVPATILSRCQRFEFRLADKSSLLEKLKKITQDEGAHISDDALNLVIRQAGGSFRDSESILEKIIHIKNENNEITITDAQNILGLSRIDNVSIVARSLIAKDFESAKTMFYSEVVSNGQNIDIFISQLIDVLRESFLELDTERVFEILKVLFTLSSDLRHEDKKALLVEIAMYEICKDQMQNNSNYSPNINIETKDIATLLKDGKAEKVNPIKKVSKVKPETEVKQDPNAKMDEISDTKLITLEKLQEHWLDLVNIIGVENVHLSGYILNSRPLSVSGQIITVVVKYKLHKNLLEKYSSVALLNDSLGKVFPEAKPMIFKFILLGDVGNMVDSEKIVNQDEIMGDVLK